MSRFRLAFLLLLLVGTCAPCLAHAGRRPFSWVYDTEVLPERGVEFETWVTDRVQRTPRDTTDWWIAPVIGVTEHLEIALPIETGWRQDTHQTQILDYGIDVRYRFASPDKTIAGPVVPYLRVGAYRPMADRKDMRLQGDFVLGIDPHDRLHIALDVGGTFATHAGSANLIYGAGATWKAQDSLQLGVEWWGVDPLRKPSKGFVGLDVLGPTVGWTFGRSWLTLGVLAGIGDGSPVVMSRLLWAIAW
jgi:hypothetical protein